MTQYRNPTDLNHLVSSLNSEPNLQFIIRERDMEKALENPNPIIVEMALKKAALYADKSILLTKGEILTREIGRTHTEANPPETYTRFNVSQSLKALYEQHTESRFFDKVFNFIPEYINEEFYEFEDQDNFTTDTTSLFSFTEVYSNKYGIDVSLSDPKNNAHIFESLQCRQDEISVLNVWLPQLKNVPLELLLELREDEGDSFSKFHYALKNFVGADNQQTESTSKLKELFQYVDYEVRTLNTKMEQIRKSKALKTYEAILGFSVMGLCLALPSETAKMVSAFVGTYELKEFVGFLFKNKEEMFELKKSDFYIPWMCGKKENK